MRKPQKDRTPINGRIKAKKVRLITEDGEQKGVVATGEALEYAKGKDLDLVVVSGGSNPPVCKVMDYSKHKYQKEQKEKAARKKQKKAHVHEIKLRPAIAENDFLTKRKHIERFIQTGDKVKVTIMFRGREMAHQDIGRDLLERVSSDLKEMAEVSGKAKSEGRNMSMVLQPLPEKEKKDPRASQE